MKQLTFTAMANARLRADKRQYFGIFLFISLSIFLITAFVVGISGMFLAEEQGKKEKVGSLDLVVLDNGTVRDQQLQKADIFSEIGHAYLLGQVNGRSVNLGYYDETALNLLEISPVEGRMPGNAQEIAMEKSALNILALDLSIGDSVTLNIGSGNSRFRTFTLVGFIPERSIYLRLPGRESDGEFPVALTSPQKGDLPRETHYLLKLKSGISLDLGLKTLEGMLDYRQVYFGLDFGGRQQRYPGIASTLDVARSLFLEFLGITSLAFALVLSCGVCISIAMETMLSKRQEEIGILRALGATKKQIRKIFGRESIVLALLSAPISVSLGSLFIWLLSLWMPQQIRFCDDPRLTFPILVLSLLAVIISGYLPLLRASRCMPMGNIRESSGGKKSPRVKPQKLYDPARLLAARKLQLHPTRQLGASILVCLMLLCTGYFLVLAIQIGAARGREPGFILYYTGGMRGREKVYVYDTPEIPGADLDEIRGLPQVTSVETERRMPIVALFQQVPCYAIMGDWENLGLLTDDLLEEARAIDTQNRFSDDWVTQARADYESFRKTYDLEGCAYAAFIHTIELTPENLENLHRSLSSGTIDPAAMDRGEQVIIIAPDIWVEKRNNGSIYYYQGEDIPENAGHIAWNDAVSPGECLPLLQLYRTEEEGPVTRKDAQVTVSGIAQDLSFLNVSAFHLPAILTTEKGLAAMGLRPGGLQSVNIYLDGVPALEEEKLLEETISAIARRSSGLTLHNNLQWLRENRLAQRQTILLFTSLSLLFFAVSVGMIVSTVSRQLDTDERTLGMLRAVGADEKTLLSCYRRQFTSTILRGLVLSLLLILLAAAWVILNNLRWGISPELDSAECRAALIMSFTACAMSGVCHLSCRGLLHLQIHSVIGRSIIDSIKEL